MRHWPFGLGLPRLDSHATTRPAVRAELVEAWLARPRPFGLTLRRGSGQGPPAADRSSVPACACGSCSLREAAPGFRPGSRPPFLYRQERRQRSDPCLLGPRVARAALRCSVFAARAQLASFTTFTALKQTARSQLTKRAAHAAPNPCAPRRPPRGPRAIRSFAAQTFPVPPRFASGASTASVIAPMRSELNLVFVSPFGRAEQHSALRRARKRAS